MFNPIPAITSFLAQLKTEVIVGSIVGSFLVGIGLLANQITSPKVILVFQTVAMWEQLITKQFVFSTVVSLLTAGLVWLLREKIVNSRLAALKKLNDQELAEREEKATNLKNERDRIKDEHSQLLNRVTLLEKAQAAAELAAALLRQRATPLLEAAESRMIDMLTHPHPDFKIPDALLAQVKIDHIITPELAVLLKERETSDHPDVTNGEKLAAGSLPGLSELVLVEKEAMKQLTLVTQIVSSPAAEKKEEATK